jgi:hypothetical protein
MLSSLNNFYSKPENMMCTPWPRQRGTAGSPAEAKGWSSLAIATDAK